MAKAESMLVSVAIDYEGVRQTHKKDQGTAEKQNAFFATAFIAGALQEAHFQNTSTRKVGELSHN